VDDLVRRFGTNRVSNLLPEHYAAVIAGCPK